MRLRASLCALAFTALASAQQTHIVGAGGFPDVNSAYTAAASGDIILIRLTQLPPFTLSGKGMTILADGVRPTVGASNGQSVSIRTIPADETLFIEGIDIVGTQSSSTLPDPATLMIQSSSGAIVLRDVQVRAHPLFTGPTPRVGVEILASDRVFIDQSRLNGENAPLSTLPPFISGGAHAVRVIDSNVFLFDSAVKGGNAPPCNNLRPQGPNGHAIVVNNSDVTIAASDLTGGYTTAFFCSPASPGLPATFTATRASLSNVTTQPLGGIARTIQADPQSTLHVYGNAPVGSLPPGSQFDAQTLPELRVAMLAPDTMQLTSTLAPPRGLLFLAFGIKPFYAPFEPHGFHGTLAINLDGTSAHFLTATHDLRGTWTETFAVPPSILPTLANRPFLFQGYIVDPTNDIWASTLVATHF